MYKWLRERERGSMDDSVYKLISSFDYKQICMVFSLVWTAASEATKIPLRLSDPDKTVKVL
jgi:hypothetical protein